MNFIKKIDYLFDHIGYEKIFLIAFPMLVAFAGAFELFKVNRLNGLNMMISILLLCFSINIFDDFMDWTLGRTNKRHELEQLGIRGNYLKCAHFYYDKKSPRTYLFIGFLFFVAFLFFFLKIVITTHEYLLLLVLPLLFVFGFIVYSDFGKNITKYVGDEIFATILIAPISMITVFYIMTHNITIKSVMIDIIFFFLVFNIIYISSLLNYKQDKMIEKKTLSTIFDTSNFKIYFLLFLTLIPYIIVYVCIFFKIFSNIYYIIFLSLPFSVWCFYLMYMFEKEPQKSIKWHVLMGIDTNNIKNEQNNLSWYYVRYNFARNIFIFLAILFKICSINFQALFVL